MTRIVYHWFRGVQLYIIRSKLILYYRNTTWYIRNAFFFSFFKIEFLMKWETAVIWVKSAPVLSTRHRRLCDTLGQVMLNKMIASWTLYLKNKESCALFSVHNGHEIGILDSPRHCWHTVFPLAYTRNYQKSCFSEAFLVFLKKCMTDLPENWQEIVNGWDLKCNREFFLKNSS